MCRVINKTVSITLSLVLLLTTVASPLKANATSSASSAATTSSTAVSASAVTPISSIDSPLSTSDKIVMNVDGKPFFFNGIQIRDDKIKSKYNLTDDQFKQLYQQAADDGFTAVNSQILWSDIQPDQVFSAAETTYISGGSNADTNFASSSSIKAKYDLADASNQAISYIKFDFSSLSDTTYADASKIRIYVNSVDGGTVNLHLYGIADDSWDASKITWNSGAPDHNGYDLAGTEGTDYFDISGTPSYDPVNKANVYDFDVTDFLNNHAFKNDKKASFILKTDTTDSNGATINGAAGASLFPQLVISRASVWNYSWLDKLVGWAGDANLKMDLLWFGSNTTKVTSDARVPYYVIRNYEKSQDRNGRVLISKGTGAISASGQHNTYQFLMSMDDPNLRSQEYSALKGMMDHIAEYNAAHGNKKTVIGVDLSNEPGNAISKGRSYSPYSQALWKAGGYTSPAAFMNDSYWTWVQNLGKAVKDSNYPVWTRINFHSSEFNFVHRNEEYKASGGTSYVDFVGYDPYIHTTDEGYRYGNGLWPDTDYSQYNYGSNLPMIMETNAHNSNSDYLDLATIAGGAIYNLYCMLGETSSFDLHKVGTGNTLQPNNSNLTGIVNTNKWLKTLWYDLATKKPDGAGGTNLDFFNEHVDASANVTKKIRSIDINYDTTNKGVGISVNRGDKDIALGSKTASTFTLKNLLSYGAVSVTTGYYNADNNWVSTGTKSFSTTGNDLIINMNAYETVLVQTTASIPEQSVSYSVNDNFNSQTANDAPSGWTTDTTQGTVAIANRPGALDKSVRIARTSTSTGETFAKKSFTPVSAVVTVEAKVRFDATNAWFCGPYLYDSSGNNLFGLAFDASGKINYMNSNGACVKLQSYLRDAWYAIKAVVNTDADTYSLYINGMKILSQVPLITPVSNVAGIKFFTQNTTTGAMNFDSVVVHQDTGTDSSVGGLSGYTYDPYGIIKAGVMVQVQSGENFYTATSDSTGFYSFSGIPVGAATVTASLPNYTQSDPASITICGADVTLLNLTLGTCTLTTGAVSGKVSSISGAAVTVTDSHGTVLGTALTAADGTYTIGSVPVGTGYTVTVSKTGYNDGTQSCGVGAGYTTVVNISITPVTPPTVDKSALQSLYDANKDKSNDNYTTESWNAFQTALSAANTVLDAADATQEQANGAAQALTEALSELKTKSASGNSDNANPKTGASSSFAGGLAALSLLMAAAVAAFVRRRLTK